MLKKVKAWVALLIRFIWKDRLYKKKTRKGETSPIRKDNKIELGASCFGTNTLAFPCTYTIAEERTLIYSHERPFFSTYNTEDKKDPIIHLQRSRTSYCLSKFDTLSLQKTR